MKMRKMLFVHQEQKARCDSLNADKNGQIPMYINHPSSLCYWLIIKLSNILW